MLICVQYFLYCFSFCFNPKNISQYLVFCYSRKAAWWSINLLNTGVPCMALKSQAYDASFCREKVERCVFKTGEVGRITSIITEMEIYRSLEQLWPHYPFAGFQGVRDEKSLSETIKGQLVFLRLSETQELVAQESRLTELSLEEVSAHLTLLSLRSETSANL